MWGVCVISTRSPGRSANFNNQCIIRGSGENQVLNRFAKLLSSLTIAAAMGVVAAQAPPPEKKVKDQGEYDLFTEVGKTNDPQKRLSLLNTWREKYPDTAFKEERLKYYLGTYQQLNQAAKMVETAKEIIA